MLYELFAFIFTLSRTFTSLIMKKIKIDSFHISLISTIVSFIFLSGLNYYNYKTNPKTTKYVHNIRNTICFKS